MVFKGACALCDGTLHGAQHKNLHALPVRILMLVGSNLQACKHHEFENVLLHNLTCSSTGGQVERHIQIIVQVQKCICSGF